MEITQVLNYLKIWSGLLNGKCAKQSSTLILGKFFNLNDTCTQQVLDDISVHETQFGVIGQYHSIGAVTQDQAWRFGAGFPTRLVAHLVQPVHCLIKTLGQGSSFRGFLPLQAYSDLLQGILPFIRRNVAEDLCKQCAGKLVQVMLAGLGCQCVEQGGSTAPLQWLLPNYLDYTLIKQGG